MIPHLKPCLVFDIDETLMKTPDNNSPEALASAPFYTALIPLFNTGGRKFIVTSRCETLRECTEASLRKHIPWFYFPEGLLMRPKHMNDWKIHTPFEVRKLQIELIKERGYIPSVVFDDNMDSLRAFSLYCPDAILFKADPFNRGKHPTSEEWNKR